MEEDNNNNYNASPFTSTALAFSCRGSCSGSNNVCVRMQEEALHNHHYHLNSAPRSAAAPPRRHAPTTFPSWLFCHPTPQHHYVDFLAQNGASLHVQKEILPFSHSSPGSSGFFTSDPDASTFDVVHHKNSNEAHDGPAATVSPSTVPNRISRQNAADSDRRRRLRISAAVDALQELLPPSRVGGRVSVLDDIIDHIKYLQFQVKELSRSKLGGESSSTPFVLLEGYGHFLVHENHEQMQNEPLEEMMGKLMELNPLAAAQLLESRGLIMMPMSLG